MSFSQEFSHFLLGTKIQTPIPKSVQHAISEQQHNSEQLISWALLFVIVIVSTVYLISPKPKPLGINFDLVMSIISIYFIFALIRLYLSYRENIPNSILIISVIADVILFMTVIFSFHLIYKQPPYFYLRIPFQQYIYILLVLRALCFEVKYVIIFGVLSALGWTILSGYAIFTIPDNTITRDYVEYLLSHKVYIVAEGNKVLTILLVTFIISLAVVRSKRLLTRAIAETMASKELSKFFETEIVDTIIQSNYEIEPGYGEQREAAILHCDIRGFTEISKQKKPNELIKLITQYQSKMVKVILEHHGNIDKFLGDGILASFNALIKSETYIADSLRAAVAMAEVNNEWSNERTEAGLDPFRLGITVVAGDITLGIVGDISHMEYTVIGDPVNLSAKLDRFCKSEYCQVVTTEETFNLAKKQGYNHPKNVEIFKNCTVEGLNHPVNLVVLSR